MYVTKKRSNVRKMSPLYKGTIHELLRTINSLKQEMIQAGIQEGLTSNKTVELSQKLDKYIALYQVVSN